MFNVFTNNVTKTSSDACYWAPSSSYAKNTENTDIVAGIAVAVPVISVLISLECAVIVSMVALLLNAIAKIMCIDRCEKKVKPKSMVL